MWVASTVGPQLRTRLDHLRVGVLAARISRAGDGSRDGRDAPPFGLGQQSRLSLPDTRQQAEQVDQLLL
jgi:hypothetical protein